MYVLQHLYLGIPGTGTALAVRTVAATAAVHYQYGVPINDFLFAMVAVIFAATPKSAGKQNYRKT